MKTTIGHWIFLILSIIFPLFYLSMYLPIWSGKELSLANAGVFPIAIFAFQCICLAAAVIQVLFVKLRNTDNCVVFLVFCFFFIASVAFTCFTGYFFIMELLNIPWFPAQR